MLPVMPPSANTHHLHLENGNGNNASCSSANKRNSSMIFRIEHLLPDSTEPTNVTLSASSSREATDTAIVSSSNSMRRIPTSATSRQQSISHQSGSKRQRRLNGGVHMAQFTPKDTVSETVPTFALMSGNGLHSEQSIPESHSATLSQGVLRMSSTLLRKIKLSEDIHSYNALFELQNGNSVRVRTVRDIARDEELVVWFGEEVSLLMSIPFLTPHNIQGNKRYTCHMCHLTFETPNPLKIHLALGCGRQSLDILWIRLHYAASAANYNQQQQLLLHSHLTHNLSGGIHHSPIPQPPSSSTSSISPAGSPQPQSHPPQSHSTTQSSRQQRLSAFKPVIPPPSTTICPTITSIAHSAAPPTHTISTIAPSTTALSFLPPMATTSMATMSTMSALSLLQPPGGSSLNAAAQIEAIVSNMGASKQGHLCIYCGKVYSRKYGLKIHIRTHTGFKPLKCKFCLRPFGDPSNLNKHVRLHLQANMSTSSAEGYKCNLCNKTLARRRDLQRHMETRHAGGGGSGGGADN